MQGFLGTTDSRSDTVVPKQQIIIHFNNVAVSWFFRLAATVLRLRILFYNSGYYYKHPAGFLRYPEILGTFKSGYGNDRPGSVFDDRKRMFFDKRDF